MKAGPANPEVAQVWAKRASVPLSEGSYIVARNDDVKAILTDPDATPVSVAILGLIYDVSEDIARDAVAHWLRRM